jgi:hypothetical protein
MAKNASVVLRTTFPPGAKVGLHRRVGDGGPSGEAVETATVSKSSEVRFTGLEHLSQWFAVAEVDGERRVVQVTAKDSAQLGSPGLAHTRAAHAAELQAQAAAASEQHDAAVKKDPLAGSPALDGPDPSRQIVSGPRSTEQSTRLRSADGLNETVFAGNAVGVPLKDGPAEPQPHPRQEDVPDSVPQRSATLTGEATPKDPAELVPRIPQSEVSDSTPQRSATERGEAAIKPQGEVVPSLSQEDVPDKTPQRSNTPLGEAVPVPQGDPVDVKRFRDSSQATAEGATPQQPPEETVKGAAKKKASAKKGRKGAKKASSSSKASRSRAAKKAAATRKRNANKGR